MQWQRFYVVATETEHEEEYTMDNSEYMPPDPLLTAHQLALLAAGRDAADSVLVKHGGKGGAGGYRSVPEKKRKAAIADLQRLAASTPSAKSAARIEQIRRVAFGSGERWDEVTKQAHRNMGNGEKPKFDAPKALNPAAIYAAWNARREKPVE